LSYLRIRQQHCLNCEKRITHLKRAYKYCSEECLREYYYQHFAVGHPQWNILEALAETEGMRWIPKSATLYAMAYCRNVPLLEIIEEKTLGLGKTTDCLTRLTTAGYERIAELGLYDNKKEAV